MTTHLRTVAGIAVAGVAIGFAGLSAESAIANTTDDAFLAQLATQGITYESPHEARDDAASVCAQLFNGVSARDVAGEMSTQTDLTDIQAAYFVAASITFYCGDAGEFLTS